MNERIFALGHRELVGAEGLILFYTGNRTQYNTSFDTAE